MAKPAAARNEAVTDQSPDGHPAIGKADLLSFFRRSGTVRDRHLLDLFTHTGNLGRHFRTKLKAPALQSQLRKQRASKSFVAGSLVVNPGAVEKVREVG